MSCRDSADDMPESRALSLHSSSESPSILVKTFRSSSEISLRDLIDCLFIRLTGVSCVAAAKNRTRLHRKTSTQNWNRSSTPAGVCIPQSPAFRLSRIAMRINRLPADSIFTPARAQRWCGWAGGGAPRQESGAADADIAE